MKLKRIRAGLYTYGNWVIKRYHHVGHAMRRDGWHVKQQGGYPVVYFAATLKDAMWYCDQREIAKAK